MTQKTNPNQDVEDIINIPMETEEEEKQGKSINVYIEIALVLILIGCLLYLAWKARQYDKMKIALNMTKGVEQYGIAKLF